jgi:hypothetical protein
VAIFGQPGGRAVFPAAPVGTEKYIYLYSITGMHRKIDKRLDVTIGDDDRVRDFSLSSESVPVSRPAPVIMPIVVPRSR